MQISTQQAITQAISQFAGNLPTFIAVLLAWMNSNARISDQNHRIADLRSDLKELRADLKEESQRTRELLRQEF